MGLYWVKQDTYKTRPDACCACLVLSCLVSSGPVPFFLVLSCLAMAETRRPDIFCLVMSCLALLTLSCLVLCLVCLVFVLSCLDPVLSCLVLLGGEGAEGRKTEERNWVTDTTEGRRTNAYS